VSMSSTILERACTGVVRLFSKTNREEVTAQTKSEKQISLYIDWWVKKTDENQYGGQELQQ
jgi:hypothetical protein